jgi:hypothetical protein
MLLLDHLQQFAELTPVSLPRQPDADLHAQPRARNPAVGALFENGAPGVDGLREVPRFEMQISQPVGRRVSHRRHQKPRENLRELVQLLGPLGLFEELFRFSVEKEPIGILPRRWQFQKRLAGDHPAGKHDSIGRQHQAAGGRIEDLFQVLEGLLPLFAPCKPPEVLHRLADFGGLGRKQKRMLPVIFRRLIAAVLIAGDERLGLRRPSGRAQNRQHGEKNRWNCQPEAARHGRGSHRALGSITHARTAIEKGPCRGVHPSFGGALSQSWSPQYSPLPPPQRGGN